MQVKKEDVREKIISSACREFIEHGYQKASLRTIAEKAGLTKGAIYSYFKNKDALFCELANPAVRFLEKESEYDRSFYDDIARKESTEILELSILSFKDYVHEVLDNSKSFKLLLFCASGSSLQDYKERIIQLYAENFHSHNFNFEKSEDHKEEISEMLIHTLAATYVSFLEELVLHQPTREQADIFATQMAIFTCSGIEKLYSYEIK